MVEKVTTTQAEMLTAKATNKVNLTVNFRKNQVTNKVIKLTPKNGIFPFIIYNYLKVKVTLHLYSIHSAPVTIRVGKHLYQNSILLL